MKISTSFLKSSKSLKATVDELCLTDTEYLHVDIMDGKFVPNTSFSVDDVLNNLSNCSKPLDIHLMVMEPTSYIEAFKNLNAKYITIHVELDNIDFYLNKIHENNIGAGLAINPETNIEKLKPYLDKIEYIIVMGVHPGLGGQKLIPETIEKINVLKQLKEDNHFNYEISIDGGVNEETKQLLNNCDVLISGSFICMADNYQNQINKLRG